MSTSATRLISVAVLAFWMAPAAATFGLSMHLALEHHRDHGAGHGLELAELARAAAHGHHHDAAAAPDHDHDARIEGLARGLRFGLDVAAVLLPACSTSRELARFAALGPVHRRGPPRPLFEVHCALLI